MRLPRLLFRRLLRGLERTKIALRNDRDLHPSGGSKLVRHTLGLYLLLLEFLHFVAISQARAAFDDHLGRDANRNFRSDARRSTVRRLEADHDREGRLEALLQFPNFL